MFQLFYFSKHVTFGANIFLNHVKENMTITALVRNIQLKKYTKIKAHVFKKNTTIVEYFLVFM